MFLALALAVFSGVTPTAQAQYSRRTPIVEAVQKTRAGIVTVKVEHKGDAGRNEKHVGTGVLVDGRGYVVSNRHVIAAAARIDVRLDDGTTLAAKVVAEDKASDLAILRVQADHKLTALPLGPGSDLMVGETVIAVGHPFGYSHTVSTGIISALGREITMPGGAVLTNLIQTDASINPGNSGGPLLNINGELIGINVALREGAQGIAFAINVDTVKKFLSRHLSAEKVAGVRHGLTCSESVAEEGAQRQRVVVDAVAVQTPAAEVGLQHGDEIVRVAGQTVANRFDVERALWDHKPGDKVVLAVVRHGKPVTVDLTLAK
jgi:serine protease Do